MFLGYVNLSRRLGADQPVYGLKSRGLDEREELGSIEEMAAQYVADLRAAQPSGPYYLGGYCFGGNVAYEMARQLAEQGESVALVALIDSAPSNAGYERVTWWHPAFPFRFFRNLTFWLADFFALAPSQRRNFVFRKIRATCRKVQRRLFGGNRIPEVDLEDVIDPGNLPESEHGLWRLHLTALATHIEKSYSGRITLLRTRGQP